MCSDLCKALEKDGKVSAHFIPKNWESGKFCFIAQVFYDFKKINDITPEIVVHCVYDTFSDNQI